MRSLLALLLAGVSLLANAESGYLIHAGRLIDTESGKVQEAMTIHIDNNRITEVTSGYAEAGTDQKIIDLKDQTVLPGLMDMHVHLTGEMSPRAYTENFYLNPADYALRSTVYAKRTLMAGFTTVRNPGDDADVTIALRSAIEKGWVQGPRIVTAGKSIATTGGHADPTNGVNIALRGDPGPKDGVVNGVAEARKAVRQRYKDGADFIKITGTGGVLSLAKSGRNPQFFEDEVQAIVDTAHDYDMPVAVHAHGAEGMKRAIRAGVDSIEHGTYMDDEAIKLMKKHGTWYVPTILAGKYVAEKAAEEGFFPEVVRPKAAAIGPQIQDTFAKAWKAGVKIAYGTDSGVSAHGDNAREFIYMVEAGMPAMAAIQSATINAATLIRRQDELGSIKAGKLADIIAVDGNPDKNIEAILEPVFIMKDGAIFKQ